MRIALLNPTFLMRRPIAELAALLAERGHEVTVVWPMNKRATAAQLHFDKLLKGNERITVLPIWSKEIGAILWNVPTDLGLIPKLWWLGRTHDLVQVWAPFYPMPLLPFIMKRLGLFRAKLIGTYDTIPSFSFSMGRVTDKLFRLFFWLMTKPFLNAADITTVYSDLLHAPAVQAGFAQRKLRTLPTGVHLSVKELSGDIRKELGLQPGVPIVLFIGLINKRKGVFKLLDVAESLKVAGQPFYLLAVGKGPEQEQFTAAITERGLEKEVLALGRRQDVENFYHAAEVFILPAEGEGLPGVIMESLSYGLPVVASDIPCIPDLVQTGENGVLVPPANVEGFSQAVLGLLRDPKLAKRMGATARSRIVVWGWSTRVQETESLYQAVLDA